MSFQALPSSRSHCQEWADVAPSGSVRLAVTVLPALGAWLLSATTPASSTLFTVMVTTASAEAPCTSVAVMLTVWLALVS